MKIEERKLNNFLTELLNPEFLQSLQLRALKFDTETPDFRSILKGIGESDMQFAPFIKIDSLTKEDIEFFRLCSESKELTINNINPKDMRVDFTALQEGKQQVSYKSVNFSKGLFNLIEYSFKTQKPVRLDFQGKSSVILKVGAEGKLTAEFISSDAAMEYALKSAIPSLRHKMDSEGIPYQDIYYKEKEEGKGQNNKNKKKKNKGEGQ